MFASGYNQGLKAACDALSILLADLRAPEVNSDSEKVCYGEDDNPFPKNLPPLPSIQQEGSLSRSFGNNDLGSYTPPSPATFVTNPNSVGKE